MVSLAEFLCPLLISNKAKYYSANLKKKKKKFKSCHLLFLPVLINVAEKYLDSFLIVTSVSQPLGYYCALRFTLSSLLLTSFPLTSSSTFLLLFGLSSTPTVEQTPSVKLIPPKNINNRRKSLFTAFDCILVCSHDNFIYLIYITSGLQAFQSNRLSEPLPLKTLKTRGPSSQVV